MKKPWTGYPTRICRTMHECCICKQTIFDGQDYYDGGYGKRAHFRCAIREEEKLKLKDAKSKASV